jgi:N6-L-threonylcarbamoyladenine synthase
MNILAIETSCDETGIALLKASGGLLHPRFELKKNLVSSQIKLHRPFGGVVPNLAKREHLKNLPILFKRIAKDGPAKKDQKKSAPYAEFMRGIDLITVTVGPGLEPALWTGIEFAKQLAKDYHKPLLGANHLEGHLYSFLLKTGSVSSNLLAFSKRSGEATRENDTKNIFPAIALIVSGGHTVLLRVESFSKWRRLGETRDDAAGEAFDKVARMLDLPYPGGPEIEKAAKQGDPGAIAFPRPMIHEKSYDFSFSGLKTSVLYYVRDHAMSDIARDEKQRMTADIAASFQQASIDVLLAKTMRAAETYGAKSVILCGGVAANKALRNQMKRAARDAGRIFFVPEFKYNLDNAAMIGAAGYMAFLRKKKRPMRADGTMEV